MEPTDRSVELTAERARSSGTVVRLTVRVPAHEDGRRPSTDELAEALRSLELELDALIGETDRPAEPARTDRELAELLLAYRPRQPELVELLRAEEPARPVGAARPVELLTRTYQIETLKQAGAVRSRREISFEEYMALKRHFESAAARRNPPD